jgi:hypothetical protein
MSCYDPDNGDSYGSVSKVKRRGVETSRVEKEGRKGGICVG